MQRMGRQKSYKIGLLLVFNKIARETLCAFYKSTLFAHFYDCRIVLLALQFAKGIQMFMRAKFECSIRVKSTVNAFFM